MQLTLDRLLDRRIILRQPKFGYRAGSDSVLLAAAVPALAGQTVLDVGSGVGAVVGSGAKGTTLAGAPLSSSPP